MKPRIQERLQYRFTFVFEGLDFKLVRNYEVIVLNVLYVTCTPNIASLYSVNNKVNICIKLSKLKWSGFYAIGVPIESAITLD